MLRCLGAYVLRCLGAYVLGVRFRRGLGERHLFMLQLPNTRVREELFISVRYKGNII